VPGEKKRGAKTLTLSLRLDPRTKFILDFVTRIKGQSITTVVERAIKDMADRLGMGVNYDDEGIPTHTPTWRDFWDPSEGVRTLKLLRYENYPTSFDEDELIDFTLNHDVFFYLDIRCREPNRALIGILWPRIDHYLEVWRQTKSTDHWAACEAMKADLAAAGVAVPDYPPKARASDDPNDHRSENETSETESPRKQIQFETPRP
jgi:hypothetical protein